MASRIQGITVEIGGDTTGLSKALSGVNKEISNTEKQLKDVERLLKLDPSNTELLEQKQRLLGKSVSDTKSKLDSLKDAEKQVQEQFKRGEVSQQQYDALKREIIATEQSLETLEKQADKSNAALSKIGATADSVAEGANKVADKTKAMSAAAAGVVAGLAGAAYKAVTASDDLNTLAKQTGFTTAELQKMDYAADMIDVDRDTITGSISKMRKNMVSDATAVVETWDKLGVSVRDNNGELRNSTDVFYETLDALSKVENETERDTLAMQIFGKSADQLAGIVDDGGAALKALGQQAEETGLIMSQDTLDGLNAVNDKIDTLKANASATLAQTGAKAMEAMMPVFDSVIEKVGTMLEWLGSLDAEQLQTILIVAAVVASISPIAGIVAKISESVSFLTDVVQYLISNPMVALAAGIVALVLLIATKGDEIQAILQKVDDFLQGVFTTDWTEQFGILGEVLNGFFANVSAIWSAIKSIFDGVIDFIRGVFTGDWERAWTGVKEIFSGIFGGLGAIAKIPLNAIITMLNAAIGGINTLINGLNKINFDIPGWVPGLGGKSFGLNIPNIGKIPYLANGGILSHGSAIVGEAGPELITMSGGDAVVRPLTATVDTQGIVDALNASSSSDSIIAAIQSIAGSVANAVGDRPMRVQVILDSKEIKAGQNRLARAMG